MSDDLVTITVALIGVLGGAGFWKYLEHKSTLASKAAAQEKSERAEFRESLKGQVDSLKGENRELREKIETLLREMTEVRSELAAAKATIDHLEEQLRNRR